TPGFWPTTWLEKAARWLSRSLELRDPVGRSRCHRGCAEIGDESIDVEAGSSGPRRPQREVRESVASVGDAVIRRHTIRRGGVDGCPVQWHVRDPVTERAGRVVRVRETRRRLQNLRGDLPSESRELLLQDVPDNAANGPSPLAAVCRRAYPPAVLP